ncbi:hypothetical protein C0058_24585 [Pseudomonas sp. NC02]|nr:hypothetical protein C0058_24585 [Pseudomonas sp. NC02]
MWDEAPFGVGRMGLFCAIGQATYNPCGSGLAREGGVSVSGVLADTPPSRASPLPHLDCIPRLVIRWGDLHKANKYRIVL